MGYQSMNLTFACIVGTYREVRFNLYLFLGRSASYLEDYVVSVWWQLQVGIHKVVLILLMKPCYIYLSPQVHGMHRNNVLAWGLLLLLALLLPLILLLLQLRAPLLVTKLKCGPLWLRCDSAFEI